jgi:hypothetical protein
VGNPLGFVKAVLDSSNLQGSTLLNGPQLGNMFYQASNQLTPPGTGFYNEDFTTTTYQDAIETNVSGWGNGQLQIPRNNPILAGSYDTFGTPREVFVTGDYAFIADGSNGLVVVNVTNPSQPTLAGTYATSNARDVFVSGNCAYIADATDGLVVVNVTNPSQPTLAGTYASPATDVFVVGDYVYFISSGLKVVNVTVPSQPTLVDDYPFGGGDVFVSGNYAYLARGNHGLEVVNVTVPSQLTLADSIDTDGLAYSVVVDGNYAYIADYNNGLTVVNVTDPSQLTLAGNYDISGSAWDVFVAGNYAYVTDWYFRLVVVNVTVPSQPTLAGSYNTTDFTYNVFVKGNYAYVTDDTDGLVVLRVTDSLVELTDPPTCPLVGSYDTAGNAYGVFVAGNFAYVADGPSGLVVVNVTVPSQPVFMNSYDTAGFAYSVFVDGDYAYIADGSYGLVVVNVTVPSQPSWVGSYDTAGTARDVVVTGDLAYVADEGNGLVVVNVTVPSQPSWVGSYDTAGSAYGVFVAGNFAYVADGPSGLVVVNVTVPSQPTLVTSYDTSGTANGVFVEGNLAYVADYDFGLVVVNVTVPSQLILVGSYDTLGYAWDVVVVGDYAYIPEYGFQVLNVTDPSLPTYATRTEPPSLSRDVVVIGDYAFVASSTDGLAVLEVQRNLCRQFQSLAVAQSLPVFLSSPVTINRALLTMTASIPSGTVLTCELSADDGIHWESVTIGIEHTFAFPADVLRWRILFSTSEPIKSPTLDALSISITTALAAPTTTSPTNGALLSNDTPTFDWSIVSGAVNYLLQLDRAPAFNTLYLRNETATTPPYTLTTPLGQGPWYWRVAANDSDHDLGFPSSIFMLEIDSQGPSWDYLPINQVVELGSLFEYDLNVSDYTGVDSWWLNDSVQFSIDATGVITNNTFLGVGDYGVQVWVNDTLDNIQTASFTVSVHDTTIPTWVTLPSDQTLGYHEPFAYQISASDLGGIDNYWIDDTTHFAISSAGIITNTSNVLPSGNYSLEARAYDPSGNYCSATFTITVLPAPPPGPFDWLLGNPALLGLIGSVIGAIGSIGAAVIGLRARKRKKAKEKESSVATPSASESD